MNGTATEELKVLKISRYRSALSKRRWHEFLQRLPNDIQDLIRVCNHGRNDHWPDEQLELLQPVLHQP